ncbi:PREDICTED: laccase-7-like [Populus euphratica]|uniref:Laccase n=1 Tax=Populus euphratica TaxID=75702 RepID=A0AAJ6TB15_POPEU|nr:PREDICTED: laccase-7-like [Populus euphratica]
MLRLLFLLTCALALLASSVASAAIVEHSFYVKNRTVRRLCSEQVVTAVNGSLPGPTLRVREGDTLIVHVFNKSPYDMSIHWHGVFQLLSAWADGPSMVTQCPITPGGKYTYKFKLLQQEGTLWWHAHFSLLRATVYGALIIRPRSGHPYPFPKPNKEVPILLGEWWNANVADIERQAAATGALPNISDAYTINGLPGDLYNCSRNRMYKLKVQKGKTYLLRIINAALDNQLFFKIANHKMTVVAVDAGYTVPYVTDVVVTGPGQTVDVLLAADQEVGSYFMAANAYASAGPAPPAFPAPPPFDNTTTRGIVVYEGAPASATPIMPLMPAFNDTPTAHKFFTSISGLAGGPHWVPVPRQIDEHMFVTVGLGLSICPTCLNGTRLSASMNNFSFERPSSLSMLQAFFFNVSGIYTPDFPDTPPIKFDYTNIINAVNPSLLITPKSTSVKVMKYNATVEMVLQNTALLGVENHPMHLHGFNFHVLAQGFGNYDPVNDPKKFNLINPVSRNTINVPVGGWGVIRFTANNPGVWFIHCHLEAHLPTGLATALVVENGPTPESTLPPPPVDLPQC